VRLCSFLRVVNKDPISAFFCSRAIKGYLHGKRERKGKEELRGFGGKEKQ
jgi:hypothetical protein